jgi:hypothetical protein
MNRFHGSVRALLAALSTVVASRTARAAGPAEVYADDVVLDGRGETVEVRGNVRVDAAPFFLTSRALKITRSWRGLELDGEAQLSFCACSGPPLVVSFTGAAVAPPADLFIKSPRLAFFGVPVLWLPYFWLRAPSRVGLLPPDLALRGQDGVFLGGGVHLPLATKQPDALALRGGGYVLGGYAVSAEYAARRTHASAKLDSLRGELGVALEARASTGPSAATQPWQVHAYTDVDALWQRRAVVMTTSLEEAARPLDRAETVTGAFARDGSNWGNAGVRGFGVRAWGGLPRSSDAEAGTVLGGPSFAWGSSLALGSHTVLAATIESLGLFAASRDELTRLNGAGDTRGQLSRARVRFASAASLGPIGVRASGRSVAGTRVYVAREGTSPSLVGAASVSLGLPLARTFGREAELRHRVEPHVGISSSFGVGDPARGPGVTFSDAALADVAYGLDPLDANGVGTRPLQGLAEAAPATLGTAVFGRGLVDVPPGVRTAWAPRVGVSSVLGDAQVRSNFALDAALLAVGAGRPVRTLGRARLTLEHRDVEVRGDVGLAPATESSRVDAFVSGMVRVGRTAGAHLIASLAYQEDRSQARDLRLVGSLALDDDAILVTPYARNGWTLGAQGYLPLARWLRIGGGADIDPSRDARVTVLGARGLLEFRDKCDCVAFRLVGSHRLGRPWPAPSGLPGVDIWFEVDLHPAK